MSELFGYYIAARAQGFNPVFSVLCAIVCTLI